VRRWTVIVAMTGLAACAGPRPEIPPSAAVVPPETWRADVAARSGDVSKIWWKGFGDPVLVKIVETALANNPDIAIAAERVAEARAQFHFARAQQLPLVSGAAEGGRDREVNPAFGIPEEQTSGEAVLAVSYDLDLFGQLAEASEARRAQLLSSEASRDNVRLAVAASAASGYVTLRAFDARLDVLRRTLTERAESLRIIQRRRQVGYTSELDLAQAEADYRAAEQQIPVAELAITRQENGLSVLLGQNPREIERGLELARIAVPSTPVGAPAALLRRRPDIASAEEQLVASDHALNSARAAFMPDVRLSADGGVVGSTLFPGPVNIFSAGGSILGPILDFGRLEAQQEAVAAQRNQAAYSYRKTALTAIREVEDAMAAERRLNEQELSLAAQRDAVARALTIATNRYRSGYSPYLDQLDAERALLSTELALVQARADRLNAAVTLYQALGGGWAVSQPLTDTNVQ
jgi:NodT family efflux transporter outer membrane factor (OMF) lipoprotein